jgi:hypothetical protein
LVIVRRAQKAAKRTALASETDDPTIEADDAPRVADDEGS